MATDSRNKLLVTRASLLLTVALLLVARTYYYQGHTRQTETFRLRSLEAWEAMHLENDTMMQLVLFVSIWASLPWLHHSLLGNDWQRHPDQPGHRRWMALQLCVFVKLNADFIHRTSRFGLGSWPKLASMTRQQLVELKHLVPS